MSSSGRLQISEDAFSPSQARVVELLRPPGAVTAAKRLRLRDLGLGKCCDKDPLDPVHDWLVSPDAHEFIPDSLIMMKDTLQRFARTLRSKIMKDPDEEPEAGK
jgi:hypothetical protein